MVRILDETYANCVDQTSSRLFYAVSAAKNLLVFGANVSNTFAEAPPPRQGFSVRPDRAFHEWWVNHKKRPPIPDGHVIPILSAMQGHPESPRLWGKHADAILRELGLTQTIHEPCLYSGIINNNRILSQNGAVEIYNDKFAVRTLTLLFGSGLPAQYWSAALLHSVYLHNWLVHTETRKTPFEGYYGLKPDLAYLKLFGSRVCVKRTGDR
jgi:hypothetical protein